MMDYLGHEWMSVHRWVGGGVHGTDRERIDKISTAPFSIHHNEPKVIFKMVLNCVFNNSRKGRKNKENTPPQFYISLLILIKS